ncbi:TasA family protein [Bacillus marinisedimentorum]|uniref:TasA family protein n=1 Tax=Bacillus marinisedimentorum TaxID=1821260 RepID=UPI0007DFAB4D|nr:TasA family protein [Bacillus marinisedimentorum]
MGFKKKMGMGIMAGAMGLSLIGGGTWAAFNDVETVDNTFAAGTLDLAVDKEVVFDITNLKPGDHFTKTLKLTNEGSLDINSILTTLKVENWDDVKHSNLPDGGGNSENQFLSQFNVTISDGSRTLYNHRLHHLKGLNGYDITQSGTAAGLESGKSNEYTITVTFVEDSTRYEGSRLFEQNKYQGEGADISVMFEATQMAGEDRSNDEQ